MSDFDVVVVGGGAAGLSAALVLSRARRTVLVVDAGAPRNAPAAHMHGFLSRDGMPPHELLAIGRDEVKGYGGEVRAGIVTELVPLGVSGFGFCWPTRSGCLRGVCSWRPAYAMSFRRSKDFATGGPAMLLHCPYCHGHEVRDQQLGVLGGSPDAIRYAQIVRQWTDDLVFFAPTATLTDGERAQLDGPGDRDRRGHCRAGAGRGRPPSRRRTERRTYRAA